MLLMHAYSIRKFFIKKMKYYEIYVIKIVIIKIKRNDFINILLNN